MRKLEQARELIEELRAEIEELRAENEELRVGRAQFYQELIMLRNDYDGLRARNAELERNVSS